MTTLALIGRAAILVAALAGCGGKQVFKLSSDENNSYELGRSLQKRQVPAQNTPINTSGQPRVFALTAGTGAGGKTIACS